VLVPNHRPLPNEVSFHQVKSVQPVDQLKLLQQRQVILTGFHPHQVVSAVVLVAVLVVGYKLITKTEVVRLYRLLVLPVAVVVYFNKLQMPAATDHFLDPHPHLPNQRAAIGDHSPPPHHNQTTVLVLLVTRPLDLITSTASIFPVPLTLPPHHRHSLTNPFRYLQIMSLQQQLQTIIRSLEHNLDCDNVVERRI